MCLDAMATVEQKFRSLNCGIIIITIDNTKTIKIPLGEDLKMVNYSVLIKSQENYCC